MAEQQIAVIRKGVAITAGTPFPVCRAISTDTAQRVTVTWADQSTSAWDMVAGTNPIAVINVASGTSGNFTAGY
jgi:hypothetical protein